jgi:hypothetical protein
MTRLCVLALITVSGWGCATSTPSITLADCSGALHAPLEAPPGTVVAFVFGSTTCPIANAMAPELERLATAATQGGAVFYFVHPESGLTDQEAIAHARAYGLTMDVLLDPRHDLVAEFDITTTPEGVVILIDGDGYEMVYQGQVNDLFPSLGKRRNHASHHWLQDAIDAAEAGTRVSPAYVPPIGCRIERVNGS